MRHDHRSYVLCLAGLAIGALVADGCIIGEKCDEHQVEAPDSSHACVCKPGYVLSSKGYGCEKCGANEEVVSDKCVCKKGFSRTRDSAPCQSEEGAIAGKACSAAADCADPNPYCALSQSPPYCTTQDCGKNDDCPTDWRCLQSGAEMFCGKPPAGLGKACQTNADCTDPDVPYCETFMTHTCIINDCVKAPSKCLSGTVCCDLSAAIGQALCVPTSVLADGKCFGGSDPVKP